MGKPFGAAVAVSLIVAAAQRRQDALTGAGDPTTLAPGPAAAREPASPQSRHETGPSRDTTKGLC